MNMFKKNGGFTLVELIVVIAILAILAGVAVPAYTGYINRANEAADITALDAIKTACMAATAEKGSVSQITVTAGGTNGAVTKVVATVADVNYCLFGTEATGEDTTLKTEYSVFMTSAPALKTGSSASWTGGEWTITP